MNPELKLEIEQNVPIPPTKKRNSGQLAVTAGLMQVGDSIGGLPQNIANNLRLRLRKARRNGVVRKEAEGTYRIWRIR